MDLDDSFTDKLLKRTKARKDYLKGKMIDSPARKKRTALVDEQQIPDEGNEGHKESPKRLCVEQVASEPEAKEDDSMEEVKENVSVKQQETKRTNWMREDEPMEEEAPFRAKGLAALRKKHSDQDDPSDKMVTQNTQQVNKPPTYVFSTNSTDICSTRGRLASLAANINGWEDNLKRSALPSTSSAKGVPARSENQFNKTKEQKTWNNVKEMGKEAEKQKPVFNKELEKPKPAFNKEAEKQRPVFNKERTLQPNFRAKEVEDTLNRSFEPSNLPLSARKALFEQAALGNKAQSEQQTFEPKLSVAQRAAMFENAPKNKFGPRAAPQKTANASPVKISTKTESPVKPALDCRSPAKPPIVLNGSPVKPCAAMKGSPAKQSPAKASVESPAKSSPAFNRGSPAKSSPVFGRDSPAKSSPVFGRGSPAKLAVNGGNSTTPTKSFIPKPPAEPPMSPSQQQWAKKCWNGDGKEATIVQPGEPLGKIIFII